MCLYLVSVKVNNTYKRCGVIMRVSKKWLTKANKMLYNVSITCGGE